MDNFSIMQDSNGNYIKDVNPMFRFGDFNNEILTLFMQFNHLKNLYRQGWLKVRVGLEHKDKCESVADHSWSVTILAITIIQKYRLNLDICKCMKMAIVHELGEISVGDYTPFDTITKEEKHELEKNAVKDLVKDLTFQNDFFEIWEELEVGDSKEAEFIKELDQFEFILQAASYGYDVQHFKRSISKIKSWYCIEMLDELLEKTKGREEPLKKG